MNLIRTEPKVFLPEELEESSYVGEIFGYYFPDTDIYNILAWKEESRLLFDNANLLLIGKIVQSPEEIETTNNFLFGVREDSGLHFFVNNKGYKKEHYNLLQNIFSRNTGILESDWMLNKTAIISGCGSVGSLVAVELTKAGVGNFVLIDNDIFNYHNICRHQCGIKDVGRFKVHALKDKILDINPYASIKTLTSILESLPKAVFDNHCGSGAILISCADNREADNYASKISAIYSIPFVSIGFWERAFAGEIFYYIPSKNMPCYECAIGTGEEFTSRNSANHRFYTNQERLEDINFEPGISIDINFVTIIGTKVILDLMNLDNPSYTTRVLDYLTQFTLVCNTNNPKIGGDLAEIFSHPLQVTKSIKVGFQNSCPPCKYR